MTNEELTKELTRIVDRLENRKADAPSDLAELIRRSLRQEEAIILRFVAERIEEQAKELKRFHDFATGLAKFEAAREERL